MFVAVGSSIAASPFWALPLAADHSFPPQISSHGFVAVSWLMVRFVCLDQGASTSIALMRCDMFVNFLVYVFFGNLDVHALTFIYQGAGASCAVYYAKRLYCTMLNWTGLCSLPLGWCPLGCPPCYYYYASCKYSLGGLCETRSSGQLQRS